MDARRQPAPHCFKPPDSIYKTRPSKTALSVPCRQVVGLSAEWLNLSIRTDCVCLPRWTRTVVFGGYPQAWLGVPGRGQAAAVDVSAGVRSIPDTSASVALAPVRSAPRRVALRRQA